MQGGGGSRRFRGVWFDLYMAVFGQPTSVSVKWLPFTNRNSDEAQTSEHDVGEGSGQPTEPQHTPTTASPSHIEPIPNVPSSSQPQKTHKLDETVHEDRGDNVKRAATTTASLDAEQDNGSGPKRQETILGDKPAQTRFERLSKQSNDPPLLGVNTPGSGEDRLNKLMEILKGRTSTLFREVLRDDEAVNIIRADGSEKYYKIFSAMLDDFDRQDVLDLYRLVKEKDLRQVDSFTIDRYWNYYSHAGRKKISSYTRNAFKDVE
ncbi:hypothetical protein Tco_1437040 [Tanacetum coccineum]